jgi:hypothetical protein
MTTPTDIVPETRLRGRALTAARAAWLAVFIFAMVIFALALPTRYAQLLSPEDEIRAGLTRLGYSQAYIEQYGSEAGLAAALAPLGLPPTGYAAFFLTLEMVVALVYVAVALVILWRKSDSLMGLFASLFLITFGIGGSSYLLLPFQLQNAAGQFLVAAVATLAYSMLPLFFYLFPDGRLTPRWAWLPAAFWALTTFFWNFTPVSPLNPTNWPPWLYFPYLAFIWGSSALAQIYRYRRVSSAAQRQQTKWLVFGFGLLVLLLFPTALIPVGLGLGTETLYSILIPIQTLTLSIIPVALAIAILRYRLWDIDLIIRRTLIYSALTALLALTYFGLVIVLQGAATALGGARAEWVTVASTLAVAALVAPLRRRVQAFIDRRFYRSKYNAAQTLVDFAALARDETDLNALTARLVRVVQETLEPESASVWLRDLAEKPAAGLSRDKIS